MSINFGEVKCVVFDGDGTIFDRRPLKEKAFIETFNNKDVFGSIHTLNRAEYAQVEDMKSKEAIPELFQKLNLVEPENFLGLISTFVVERRRYCQAPTLCNTKFSSWSRVKLSFGCGGFVCCKV